MLKVLMNEPLNYEISRQKGSHRMLKAVGRPDILFSYHDGVTVPPGVVRKILVKTVGMTEEDALDLL